MDPSSNCYRTSGASIAGNRRNVLLVCHLTVLLVLVFFPCEGESGIHFTEIQLGWLWPWMVLKLRNRWFVSSAYIYDGELFMGVLLCSLAVSGICWLCHHFLDTSAAGNLLPLALTTEILLSAVTVDKRIWDKLFLLFRHDTPWLFTGCDDKTIEMVMYFSMFIIFATIAGIIQYTLRPANSKARLLHGTISVLCSVPTWITVLNRFNSNCV